MKLVQPRNSSCLNVITRNQNWLFAAMHVQMPLKIVILHTIPLYSLAMDERGMSKITAVPRYSSNCMTVLSVVWHGQYLLIYYCWHWIECWCQHHQNFFILFRLFIVTKKSSTVLRSVFNPKTPVYLSPQSSTCTFCNWLVP